MDLRAILSPATDATTVSTSRSTTPGDAAIHFSPAQSRPSSHPRLSGRPSSSLLKNGASPLSQSLVSRELPAHLLNTTTQANSSPLISPVPTVHHVNGSKPSTTQLESGAENLNSPPPGRPAAPGATSFESVRSGELKSHLVLSQPPLVQGHRTSFDISMLDKASDGPRTDFTDTSLAPEEQARLSQLVEYLLEHPCAYQTHLQIITILHQGFRNHVFPISSTGQPLPRGQPAEYDLLQELENARLAMHKLYALGEALWLDWLQDASIVAQNLEQRVQVIEKFRNAIDEEPLSAPLWSAYGDWVVECHRWANEAQDFEHVDEDKLAAQEIFTLDMIKSTWQTGVEMTKDDIALSHTVWNKFIQFLISDTNGKMSKDQANTILALFEHRLRVPHVASDTTVQLLSNFMSSHFSDAHYEEIMAQIPHIMKKAKQVVASRLYFETALDVARTNEDKESEYNTFVQYIESEKTVDKRKRVDLDICFALYRRAELRFPADTLLWQDHVSFSLESGRASLKVLSEATSHCPWSGELWAQYLLASDRSKQTYEQTEAIKHRATSTGVLEAAGIEEALRFNSAWCSYLRRRSYRVDRGEDDVDIAEIGIRAAMESISSLGAKLGLGDMPDPTFRLQRIYINFLSENGRWDNARQEFDQAVSDYGKSWRFWLRFYYWEMSRWRKFNADDEAGRSTPHLATAVLKNAVEQPDLDYPEPMIDAYISHLEDFEDADELQEGLLRVRRIQNLLNAKHQAEALEQAQTQSYDQQTNLGTSESFNGLQKPVKETQASKRKFDSDETAVTLVDDAKRPKLETQQPVQTVKQAPADAPKRDRENATVLVQNLPDHVRENRVRQFFSTSGQIMSLKVLESENSAIVEFMDDEAARYALLKDGQEFEGSTISVVLDTGSTVFLTNYAPDVDENSVRALLNAYGELVSVRFPSLQGNKKRRFCYVQFKLPMQAQKAVDELDGKEYNGFELVCKISNPTVKEARTSYSVNDGSTIFVGSLKFRAQEADIEELFAQFGDIKLVRMPRNEKDKAKNKGIAFVTFGSSQEAEAALALHGQNFQGRALRVNIAVDKDKTSNRAGSVLEDGKDGKSATPHPSVRQASRSLSPDAVPLLEPQDQRTVFLSNVPDTVNESRLRKIGSAHGDVLKCLLKTNHQGALIEFKTVAQAGAATLGIDGFEIEPGRNLRVVTEEQMKERGPEKKLPQFAKQRTSQPSAASGFVKRPTAPGARRGGGKLGQRSAMLHTSQISHKPAKDVAVNGNGNGSKTDGADNAPRSNDDFRALMTGNKQ